ITTAASPASRLAPFATVIDLYQAGLGLPPARGRTARAQVVHRLHHLMTRAGLSDERAREVSTDLDRAMELRDGLGVAREAADRLGAAATPLAIATVFARSGGNPLFVEELAQAVRDAGPRGEDVPATARDVVSARIDRLPIKAKTALRYASVLGGTVRTRLLE